MSSTHLHTCTLCEATCGVVVTVEGDQVVSIRGDKDDPISKGYLCAKGPALADLHHDPDRLRRPMVRAGDGWREVSWDEAFDLVGVAAPGDPRRARQRRRRRSTRATPPPTASACSRFGQPLFRALRTGNRYSATSVDQLPHMLAGLLMFGHQLLMPGARHRSHRPVHLPRRQPGGVERQPHDRPERARPAEGDPRARRPRGADRSPAHRDRRAGRRAPLHPARHRRAAAALDGAGAVRRGSRAHHRAAVAGVDDAPTPRPSVLAGGDRPGHRRRRRGRSRARPGARHHAERGPLRPRRASPPRSSAASAPWLLVVLNALTGHLDELGGFDVHHAGRRRRRPHRPGRRAR